MKKRYLGALALGAILALGAAPLTALADEAAPTTQEVASSPDTPGPTGPSPSTATSPSSTETPIAKTPTSASVTPLAESLAVVAPPTAPEASASTEPTSDTPEAASALSKPGKGHDPITICHKPGDPAQQTLTVDDNALKGHLGHGDTLGECAPIVVTPPAPTPVEGWWIMPNGGTADNVTWPQTATPAGVVLCGTTAQVDTYPSQEVLDALAADGTLTQGEDYSTVISWRFVYGGDCPPPPGPAAPKALIQAVCGAAQVEAENPGDNILTASVVVYVNGVFDRALAVAAGDHQLANYTFGEDTGDQLIEVRTGPAFGDVLLASATVDTDCEEPPVVVPPVEPPTTEPPATEPPVVTPAPAAQVPVERAAIVATPVAEQLASTGSNEKSLIWGGLAVFMVLALIGAAALLMDARQKRRRG